MPEQTLTTIIPTVESGRKRRLAVILSSLVLVVLVASVAWLVMNLNNNRSVDGALITNSTRSNGVIDVTSSTKSANGNSVSLAKLKPFELNGKVFNPFLSNQSNVIYKGEVLELAKVELISSDAVGTAADDLAISTAEYELTVQVQWDAIDTFISKDSSKTTIENSKFTNLFRLNNPDTDTTNQYTYLSNLRTTGCDVAPEADEECADSFVKLNNEASLLIRCQVIQVTGLAECDKVVRSLTVSI